MGLVDTSLIDRYDLSPESRLFAEDVINKLNEKFGSPNFRFDPGPHEYFIGETKLTSVTTFLKVFEHEFDREGKLLSGAAKKGITVEELAAQWDNKRDVACELGSNVHDKIEDTYRGKLNEDALHEHEEVNKRFAKFLAIKEHRLDKLIPIALEFRMYIEKWGLSGTMDALFMMKDNLHLFVGDWKTNAKFRTDKDYAFENLKYPFENLKEVELNVYSIQTSLYRIMLEEAGINTEGAFLCYIPEKGDAQIFKAKDFRPLLRNYLDKFCLKTSDNVEEKAYNNRYADKLLSLDPKILFGYKDE
jgi:hypothetical protein